MNEQIELIYIVTLLGGYCFKLYNILSLVNHRNQTDRQYLQPISDRPGDGLANSLRIHHQTKTPKTAFIIIKTTILTTVTRLLSGIGFVSIYHSTLILVDEQNNKTALSVVGGQL